MTIIKRRFLKQTISGPIPAGIKPSEKNCVLIYLSDDVDVSKNPNFLNFLATEYEYINLFSGGETREYIFVKIQGI